MYIFPFSVTKLQVQFDIYFSAWRKSGKGNLIFGISIFIAIQPAFLSLLRSFRFWTSNGKGSSSFKELRTFSSLISDYTGNRLPPRQKVCPSGNSFNSTSTCRRRRCPISVKSRCRHRRRGYSIQWFWQCAMAVAAAAAAASPAIINRNELGREGRRFCHFFVQDVPLSTPNLLLKSW